MRRSRWALSSFGFWPRLESPCRLLPVHCCPRQLPDVILRTFPWMLDPVPRRYTVCLHLFLPRCHRPSPKRHGSASRVYPANNDFSQALFRGCRYFVMFRPPSLLAPQIVPTAASTTAGQPGLLRPSRTRFVASPRIGYANRLKTGNWRYRDFHPVRLSALSAAPSPSKGSRKNLPKKSPSERAFSSLALSVSILNHSILLDLRTGELLMPSSRMNEEA